MTVSLCKIELVRTRTPLLVIRSSIILRIRFVRKQRASLLELRREIHAPRDRYHEVSSMLRNIKFGSGLSFGYNGNKRSRNEEYAFSRYFVLTIFRNIN